MKALLIGSIDVLVDTSELQRSAFNDAFHDVGLDWYWSRDEYRRMLAIPGGKRRIEAFAERAEERVDGAALHAHKTEIFRQMLRRGGLEIRVQTAQAMEEARMHGLKLGFVTGTDRAIVDALLNSLGGAEALGFDLVTSAADGCAAKPDPALYLHALRQMVIDASEAVAIEDYLPGIEAARAAGIACHAYPHENALAHDLGETPDMSELTLKRVA